ncbi:unnamed protein product [Nezara viridula]|uniref:Uncharacterized protein n=1 Tax=Nezara viridula TaxID=85310 RepID=A0A9P0MPL8_NEZVI|nr:unnamed protein product [Nezara viridula]
MNTAGVAELPIKGFPRCLPKKKTFLGNSPAFPEFQAHF